MFLEIEIVQGIATDTVVGMKEGDANGEEAGVGEAVEADGAVGEWMRATGLVGVVGARERSITHLFVLRKALGFCFDTCADISSDMGR